MTKGINKKKCMPIIVMTIKTLFLYTDRFKEMGFKYFFDRFIKDCLYIQTDGSSFMTSFVSFGNVQKITYNILELYKR